MDNDLFDIVYEEAEKNNYDMVGFGVIDSDTYTIKVTIITLLYFYQDFFFSILPHF